MRLGKSWVAAALCLARQAVTADDLQSIWLDHMGLTRGCFALEKQKQKQKYLLTPVKKPAQQNCFIGDLSEIQTG